MSPSPAPPAAQDDDANRRQLVILFCWFLTGWTFFSGLIGLLPVHARNLGASATAAGAYLSLASLSLMIGSLASFWLSRRQTNRRLACIVGSALMFLGVALLIWCQRLWQLTLATSLAWVCIGVTNPIANALVGLRANPSQRGRVFGVFGMAQGLGGILGGVAYGPAAERWGFAGMFALAAGTTLVMFIASLFIRDTESPTQAQRPGATTAPMPTRFWVLIAAYGLTITAGTVAAICRSMLMQDKSLGPSDISRTAAVGSAVLLAAQPLVGWMSDRLDRRLVFCGNIICTILALWILAGATGLWQFVAASIVLAVGDTRITPFRSLISDILPPQALASGMAMIVVTISAGSTIGNAAAGRAYELLGGPATFRWASLLPLLAVAVVWATSVHRRHEGETAEPAQEPLSHHQAELTRR